MKQILPPLGGLLLGFALGALWLERPRSMDGHTAQASSNLPPATEGATIDRLAATLAAVRSLDQEGTLEHFAMIGEHLPHLTPAQIAAVLDHLEKDSTSWQELQRLLNWWMRQDPAAAAAWMQPRLSRMAQDGPVGKTLENLPLGAAALKWAAAAPREALEFARQHPRSSFAAALLLAAMEAWPDRNPAHQYELLRNLSAGRARSAALEAVLGAWAATEPAAAFAAAQSFAPGLLRDDLISKVLREWPEGNARAAFDHYLALGLSDRDLLAGILAKGATADPMAAMRWLEELDPVQLARNAPVVVAKWAERDAPAALAWALEHGVQLLGNGTHLYTKYENEGFRRSGTVAREGVASAPFGSAMRTQPEATLAWVRSLPAGSADRERWTAEAIFHVKREQKLALFNELSPEGQRLAIPAVVYSFGKDSAAGQTWASSLPPGAARSEAWRILGMLANKPLDLPPGPDRDAMLHGRAVGVGERLAEPSFELVMQIADPVRRRDAFDDTMEDLIEGPYGQRDKARAWMEKADIPEEWKRPWRVASAPATPR